MSATRRLLPYLFLVPPVILLLLLPAALRGEMSYRINPTSYILSIVCWMMAFFVVLGFSLGARFTRPFIIAVTICVLTRLVYRFAISEIGWLLFAGGVLGISVAFAVMFFIAPPARRNQSGRENPI